MLSVSGDLIHPECYLPACVSSGGGDLVEMMKVASKTKNYAEVDDFIVNRLGHYMYNNGEGRLVPIDYIVMLRNRDRPKPKLVSPTF